MLKEAIILLVSGGFFMIGAGVYLSAKFRKDFQEMKEIKNIINNKEFEQIKAEYEESKKNTEIIKVEYNL